MPIPGGFRFTLGQAMAVTAIVAVLLAAALADPFGSSFSAMFWVSTAVHLAGAGVCVYNLRVSRGIWLVLVGYLGQWITESAMRLVLAVWPSLFNSSAISNVVRVTWVANTTFSLVFVAGLAVTFRDLRRRLATSEEGPDAPCDGTDPFPTPPMTRETASDG